MPAWVAALIRILAALVEEIRRKRRQEHIDVVRADPGSEWLRRFGGADQWNKDASTGPEDTGGGGN